MGLPVHEIPEARRELRTWEVVCLLLNSIRELDLLVAPASISLFPALAHYYESLACAHYSLLREDPPGVIAKPLPSGSTSQCPSVSASAVSGSCSHTTGSDGW
jgi:hypothetical protein